MNSYENFSNFYGQSAAPGGDYRSDLSAMFDKALIGSKYIS